MTDSFSFSYFRIFIFSYFRRHGDDIISILSLPRYLSLHRIPTVGFRFLHSLRNFLFLRHMAATKIIHFFLRSFLSLPLTTFMRRALFAVRASPAAQEVRPTPSWEEGILHRPWPTDHTSSSLAAHRQSCFTHHPPTTGHRPPSAVIVLGPSPKILGPPTIAYRLSARRPSSFDHPTSSSLLSCPSLIVLRHILPHPPPTAHRPSPSALCPAPIALLASSFSRHPPPITHHPPLIVLRPPHLAQVAQFAQLVHLAHAARLVPHALRRVAHRSIAQLAHLAHAAWFHQLAPPPSPTAHPASLITHRPPPIAPVGEGVEGDRTMRLRWKRTRLAHSQI